MSKSILSNLVEEFQLEYLGTVFGDNERLMLDSCFRKLNYTVAIVLDLRSNYTPLCSHGII